MKHYMVAVIALLVVGASPTQAQARGKTKTADTIPAEYRPPSGMCRVWVDGVPAAQQPAPTDCPNAIARKPANARVIYGEDSTKGKGSKAPERPIIKGFAPPPVKKNPVNEAIPRRGWPLPPPQEPWENKRMTDEQLFGDRPANPPASSSSGGFAANGGYGGTGGAAVDDPRYFSRTPSVRPPGSSSSVCLDRDQDGWCDDLRFGPPVCLDRDRDGRCDDLPEFASQAYPQTLPHMRSALDVVEGRESVEVARWLGTNEFTVRVPEQGTGTTPWRAIFLDGRNEVMQVWTDRNRDGLAERVEIFRNGQRVKLIQR